MDDFNQYQQNQDKFRQMLPNYNPEYNIYDYRVGFGRRLAAALLDMLFVVIISGVLGVMFNFLPQFENITLQNLMDESFVKELTKGYLPFTLLITFIYYSMEIFFQATPGKMAMGIMIADEAMKFASNGQLITRFILKHLDSIIQIVYVFTWIEFINGLASWVSFIIIGAFLFCLARSKQAIYDRIARTAIYFRKEIIVATSNTNNPQNLE